MRIALGVEYDGAQYCGWQRQREVISVQQVLERALSDIAHEPISAQCAGRTDTGVHGTGQVVHFDVKAARPMRAWTLGVNTKLPSGVAIRWAKEVPDDFHARFSALSRRYRYIIYNHAMRPAILNHGLSHYHGELDERKMHAAGQYLLGEHDFTSFRALQCQSKTPWRKLHHLNVTRYGNYIVVDIKANAFVHHMVRNIVGSLIEVGRGTQPPEWIQWLLNAKDRTIAGATAKPTGLYLVAVEYPEHFAIPSSPLGPLFIPDE